jgi:hypothetical protein
MRRWPSPTDGAGRGAAAPRPLRPPARGPSIAHQPPAIHPRPRTPPQVANYPWDGYQDWKRQNGGTVNACPDNAAFQRLAQAYSLANKAMAVVRAAGREGWHTVGCRAPRGRAAAAAFAASAQARSPGLLPKPAPPPPRSALSSRLPSSPSTPSSSARTALPTALPGTPSTAACRWGRPGRGGGGQGGGARRGALAMA